MLLAADNFTVDVATTSSADPGICRIYGLTPAKGYPASTVEALIIPEDAHLVQTASNRARGERIRRADTGDLRWIHRKGEIENGQDGRPAWLSGAARDITDQRTARGARAASGARCRAPFEAIDDGCCILEFRDDPHGPLSDQIHVEANPGYERQTGIARIVGQTIRGPASTEADGCVSLYGDVLRTGGASRFERSFAPAGRFIEVSATRIEPASRHQVSVLFRDITSCRTTENAMRISESVPRENIARVQVALAAGAIIGTWFWDLRGDRIFVDGEIDWVRLAQRVPVRVDIADVPEGMPPIGGLNATVRIRTAG